LKASGDVSAQLGGLVAEGAVIAEHAGDGDAHEVGEVGVAVPGDVRSDLGGRAGQDASCGHPQALVGGEVPDLRRQGPPLDLGERSVGGQVGFVPVNELQLILDTTTLPPTPHRTVLVRTGASSTPSLPIRFLRALTTTPTTVPPAPSYPPDLGVRVVGAEG